MINLSVSQTLDTEMREEHNLSNGDPAWREVLCDVTLVQSNIQYKSNSESQKPRKSKFRKEVGPRNSQQIRLCMITPCSLH